MVIRLPQHVFQGTLRTKFLLSLVLISALLTSATLLLVQYRVRIHVAEEIAQGLQNSVDTFQSLQQQRELMLAYCCITVHQTLPNQGGWWILPEGRR